jgi:hypothetical protein
MNNDYVLFNLQEAQKGLERMIRALRERTDYDSGEFVVAMTHVYHHLNTAWNARHVSRERAEACSEEDFRLWRQFPSEIDLSA